MSKLVKKIEREILYYFNSILNGRKSRTILFYPEYPNHRTIIYKILKHLKYNITSNPGHKFDLGFYWEDTTFRNEQNQLKRFNSEKIMNINCTDISKEKISILFEEIFGYGFNVDPKTYSGFCLKKNNLNAKHDGVIIKSPVEKVDEGFVYQKILDNQINENSVVDLRTPVLKGIIPFIYLKFKTMEERFTNNLFRAEIASCEEYLTADETKNIAEFCFRLGLDYGELDILRNKDDGKIYIVDVNYTPWGPPAKLSVDESRMAVIRMSEVFKKIFGE